MKGLKKAMVRYSSSSSFSACGLSGDTIRTLSGVNDTWVEKEAANGDLLRERVELRNVATLPSQSLTAYQRLWHTR